MTNDRAAPWVFAVEPDAIQLTWRRGPDGQPGTEVVDGLRPETMQSVPVEQLGTEVAVTTPAPPNGAELCRIATINDLHIGCDFFGVLDRMTEPSTDIPHAVRCARSAIHDALDWGAQLLLVKGDLTHNGSEAEWATVGELLGALPVNIGIIPGNHDMKKSRQVEPQPAIGAHGLHLVHGVEVIDMPGVRVVLADTTVPDEHRGRVSHLSDDIVRVASRASGGVLVALHHHPQRYRVPTFVPSGIPGPESMRFLRALAAARPTALVATGHSHRHRRYERGGVTVTEVGSTKDFPGTWTGYVVHEGGVRQVVRRISDPSCLPWLDHTSHAGGGLWGRWSPGRLDDRCFNHAW